MYQQALNGFEKALGADYTSTLNIVGSLGILCANQGRLKEAEEMYLQALDGFQTILGFPRLRSLASGSDSEKARIWNAETGVLQQVLEIGSCLKELTFSSRWMDSKGTRHSDNRKYDTGKKVPTTGVMENVDQTRSQSGQMRIEKIGLRNFLWRRGELEFGNLQCEGREG